MRVDLQMLAQRQCGVFTREQALAAGCDGLELRRRLRSGHWRALRTGIYAVSSGLDGRQLAVASAAAAWLALGQRGTVSHRSAALMHGLTLLHPPETAELTFPPGTLSPRTYTQLTTHTAGLPPEHLTTCGDVPITTVARTVIDLARSLPTVAAMVAADNALHLGLVRRADLRQVLADCATWPGARRAASVTAFADGRSESPLESACRLAFSRHGLPPPVPQGVVVDERDGWWAQVDFLWPAQGAVVEADLLGKYADRDVLRLEKLRQERIEELGYAVVRITWGQLTRQPAATIARIRRAFTRGAAIAAHGRS